MKNDESLKPVEIIRTLRANGTYRVQIKSHNPSKAQQHLKDEADVNSIMEKYRKTGLMPQSPRTPITGADMTGLSDFREHMDIVAQAQQNFDQLPAQLRKRFGNDPANLLDFVHDDKNRDEAIKLGLVPPPPVQNDDQTTT